MIKWDGHTHSQFCRHGSGEKTAKMVERAIAVGFKRYSITEHAPLPPGIMDDPEEAAEFGLLHHELEDYFNHIKDIKRIYADRVEVLIGLEIDYITGFETFFDDFIDQCQPHLDDMVVSVHMLEGKGGIAPLDFKPEVFASDLVDYHGTVDEVHRVYWRAVEAMVNHSIRPGITKRIGHLGLINKYLKRFPVQYDSREYDPLFQRLFASIAEKGWSVDYNVAGLKKDLFHDVYISQEMLQLCHKHQITLVYGSDAHDVESVGQFYDLYLERTGNQ